MKTAYKNDITMDPSGFVLLADYVPHIVQEIRYYSTYNFIGERMRAWSAPGDGSTVTAHISSMPRMTSGKTRSSGKQKMCRKKNSVSENNPRDEEIAHVNTCRK